ncbi:TRAP transporter small permease [Acuticoccus sp.]|uniref:TRAP transporter small permease n=1 Tax=Acuticoccus sp. TaxID=1904378 RepID=UPI003B52C59F
MVTVLAGACLTLMMLHVTADVVGRYAFNAPLPGTITFVSNFYMVGVAFLALALTERRGAHVSVEVVFDLLPPPVRRTLTLLARALTTVALGLIAVRTLLEANAKAEIGAAIQQGSITIPIWPSYYVVPVGCALMALVALLLLVREAADAPDAQPRPPA